MLHMNLVLGETLISVRRPKSFHLGECTSAKLVCLGKGKAGYDGGTE